MSFPILLIHFMFSSLLIVFVLRMGQLIRLNDGYEAAEVKEKDKESQDDSSPQTILVDYVGAFFNEAS